MKTALWMSLLLLVNSCRHGEVEVKNASNFDFYKQQELQALLDVSAVVFSRASFDIQIPPTPLAIYLQAGKTKREWLADSLFYASDTSAASTVYIADSLLSVLPRFTTTQYQDRSCYYDLKNAISTAPDGKQFDGALHIQSSIIHPILVEKLTLNGRRFIHQDRNTIQETIQGSDQLISVSRVVFNSKFSAGYLYAAIHCRGECGGGMVYRIEKRNGKWQVISSKATWIS